jgi:galactose mutarotase-like enzyme
MYASLIRQRFAEWRHQVWQAAVMRSGVITMMVVTLVMLSFAFVWREHVKGHFALLKAELKRPTTSRVAPPPQPGGQDAIVLERTAIEGSTMPEFLSATVLPGRGMNVLQIKAFVPSKGEVDLLASPPLADAATMMSGTGSDANGAVSLTMGTPIEVPWAGRIFGTAADDRLTTTWNGQSIRLPAERRNGVPVAVGGLLLRMPSTSVKTNVMPDGGAVEAVYDAGDFGDHWPSQMQISTSVQLSSRAVEMRVVARNTGNEPQPIGIGWGPRFAVSDKERQTLMLRLPSAMRAEVRDRHTGVPSGRLLPAVGTEYDFTARTGSALPALDLDDTFVQLRQALLDNGPVAELRDPGNNYGLRLTLLSSSIKAIHVTAPANGGFVTITPQFNYDDPFGREWPRDEDTGMVVLQPGRSATWRIRLEIFSLTTNSDGKL